MDRIFFELRLAIRRLGANKSFSAIAILSLTFGIGATTVFFSLVNSTLLKPLPGVERPGEYIRWSIRALASRSCRIRTIATYATATLCSME